MAQNTARKWYFGNQAGLDFSFNPPAILTNGAMNVYEGCATICDQAGNLLFYTDGMSVYNSSHSVMSNGTGLFGNNTPTQSSIIIKKPSSNTIYYIFTVDGGGGSSSAGLNYSIVDLSLSAGSGSITVKNAAVYAGVCSEKLTAVNHCNGTDIWIVTHEASTPNFRAYLLTSTGLNTTAVVSSIGSNPSSSVLGALKISPNGRKIGVALFGTGSNICELHDFDASTGVVSNSLSLGNGGGSYSCEFSPDGTKFYASKTSPPTLYQWDLCAGSNSAIAATQTTIATPTIALGTLQLAPNGKIYVARANQYTIGVIHSPNLAGTACNYVDLGQSVFPKLCVYGLPNFNTSVFNSHATPSPFTYTTTSSIGCQSATFAAPPTPSLPSTCLAPTFSLTGFLWNFGDPSSGSANTSTLSNPYHAFSTLGTYSVQLIMYYSCGGGTDTLNQTVFINQPCLSVTNTSITCSSLGSATVVCLSGTGPFSYTWSPTAQTGSVASGLGPGVYTITVYDAGANLTTSATTSFNSNVPLTGNLSATSSLSCNGINTGTASVTNLLGGTGNPVFLWTNGVSSYTSQFVNGLGASTWTVTVTDNISGCIYTNTFLITQPPALTLNIAATSPTACVGNNITLTGTGTGGTPSYTYHWTGGPASSNLTVNNNVGGTYTYTLSTHDSNSCSVTNTVSVDFINNPTLSVSNSSICPLETGTLVASGASSYTWSSGATGANLVLSPSITSQYIVTGSAFSCSSTASASIIIKPAPSPTVSSATLHCSGSPINLNAAGGNSYLWSGPAGFNTSSQNPVINTAGTAQSGVYTVTVTAANSCTASANLTITVHPVPSLSVSGSTVCAPQQVSLSASASLPATTFKWKGPGSYTSTSQHPLIAMSSVSLSGSYTVIATASSGCISEAIANVTVTAVPQSSPASDGPKCAGEALHLFGPVNPPPTTYAWNGPNGFNSALQTPTLANALPSASGLYSLTVTRGPCVVTNHLSVIIHGLPTLSVTSNSPVCENAKLILNAYCAPGESINSYGWAGPYAFGDFGQTTFRDSCQLVHNGVYTVTAINSSSCQASATLLAVVKKNPILTASSATVCQYDAATLHATGANSYTWLANNAIISNQSSAYLPSVSTASYALLKVTGTGTNGCSTTANASVSTLPLPLASAVALPGNTLCLNSTVTLKGSGGQHYTWSGPDNLLLKGDLVPLKLDNRGFSGTYTLTVVDANGCRNSTNLPIMVNPLPEGSYQFGQQAGCVPFCTDFLFKPSPASTDIIARSWMVGRTVFEKDSFNLCLRVPGDYVVNGTLKDVHGCVATFSYEINAYPVPSADFTYAPSNPVEGNDEVIFMNSSAGEKLTTFNWYFTVNTHTSVSENTTRVYDEHGLYPVALVVKNQWGCMDSVVKVVKVEQDFNLFVPNAFTPNEDNRNELFMPVTRGVKQYRFAVFNRWGQKLFETQDLNAGWDGAFNGTPCKEEVYVWTIQLSTNSGEFKEYKGHVSLVR